MNRIDHRKFKNLVEDVNKVLTNKTENTKNGEINEKLLENCLDALDEQFLNEGIELTEDQLQELWAGLKAAAGHLMSGQISGIRNVYHGAEADAGISHARDSRQKMFDLAKKKAQKRSDYLAKTGEDLGSDEEFDRLTKDAERKSTDLNVANALVRDPSKHERFGGKYRKDSEAKAQEAEMATTNLSAERAGRIQDRKQARFTRRKMRLRLHGKGDAKQTRHLEKVARRAGLDTRKYSAKGVNKQGQYVFGGTGVPDKLIDHVLKFMKSING